MIWLIVCTLSESFMFVSIHRKSLCPLLYMDHSNMLQYAWFCCHPHPTQNQISVFIKQFKNWHMHVQEKIKFMLQLTTSYPYCDESSLVWGMFSYLSVPESNLLKCCVFSTVGLSSLFWFLLCFTLWLFVLFWWCHFWVL